MVTGDANITVTGVAYTFSSRKEALDMVVTLNDWWVEMSVAFAYHRLAKISKGRKNTITTRRRSPNISDLTRKAKSNRGSSKTRRISIKESESWWRWRKRNYVSSSGEFVVDISKIKDLNNERRTSKRRVSKDRHDKRPGRSKHSFSTFGKEQLELVLELPERSSRDPSMPTKFKRGTKALSCQPLRKFAECMGCQEAKWSIWIVS
jgi:hypothetical protein